MTEAIKIVEGPEVGTEFERTLIREGSGFAMRHLMIRPPLSEEFALVAAAAIKGRFVSNEHGRTQLTVVDTEVAVPDEDILNEFDTLIGAREYTTSQWKGVPNGTSRSDFNAKVARESWKAAA